MPDPFESLRTPVVPVDPDPAFAARLRRRVVRALSLPKGVIVSQTTIEDRTAPPTALSTVTPYVIVADARAAMEWYEDVFGARRRGAPMVMEDGRVGHGELDFGRTVVYIADESPESHVAAPRPGADATVSLVVEVADVDTVVGRAVEAGGRMERAPADHPYGRNAVVRDPFHHRWMVSTSTDAPGPVGTLDEPGVTDGGAGPMRQGDVGFASLNVPELGRAEAFFGAVLGWRTEPGSAPQGRQLVGTTPHHGLWGGERPATLFLCFAVDDVDAACGRVRAAGGTATEPADRPYGRVAECVDDQGTSFALFEPPADAPTPRGPAHGGRPGDLAYVTMEVVDSTRARAFYGTVLGWRFSPGRVDDGWQLEDVHPGMGVRGGVEQATTVPMYRVDDIAAAVDRVRAEGGRASDPERRPYGLESSCVDDQGTRFYLGQL